MKTALIIGGGFSGCAAAHQLALMGGWDVTLIETAPHLGGGCKTMFHGGHPYTFGPRHFLTPWEDIYAFLDKYVPLRRCADHEFITYIEQDQDFYGFPIHVDDIKRMPDREKINAELGACQGAEEAKNLEDYWIASIGETLYKKFIEKYSKKMWLLSDNREIDDFAWSPKGATLKEGPRAAWDQSLSAYPIAMNGYDDYFEIATAECKVLLNTAIEKFDFPNNTIVVDGEKQKFDIIASSISPDLPFEYCHGELPFIGRDFVKLVLPTEHVFPEHVYFTYYAGSEDFTRVVEYKKLTRHVSPSTIIGIETPSLSNKLYPLPIEKFKLQSQQYFDEFPDTVFPIGRAGTYLYNIDIDDCIKQSFELVEKLRS
ncbi:MAG: NAD(P)-binding protein [Rhodospirillales bacterium]|nr:NAD(P)-binding protein [Rhodospirillales bacterium]